MLQLCLVTTRCDCAVWGSPWACSSYTVGMVIRKNPFSHRGGQEGKATHFNKLPQHSLCSAIGCSYWGKNTGWLGLVNLKRGGNCFFCFSYLCRWWPRVSWLLLRQIWLLWLNPGQPNLLVEADSRTPLWARDTLLWESVNLMFNEWHCIKMLFFLKSENDNKPNFAPLHFSINHVACNIHITSTWTPIDACADCLWPTKYQKTLHRRDENNHQ